MTWKYTCNWKSSSCSINKSFQSWVFTMSTWNFFIYWFSENFILSNGIISTTIWKVTYLVKMERCVSNFNNDITRKSGWAKPAQLTKENKRKKKGLNKRNWQKSVTKRFNTKRKLNHYEKQIAVTIIIIYEQHKFMVAHKASLINRNWL